MKKFLFPLLALVALFFLPACSEKFDVAAPYKSVTVVYGLLDRNDTAHYIRIQKAFLDNNKSALVMAKEVDSNTFANLNVRVARISMNGNAIASDTVHLTRVDLNVEGYPKQAGTFFNAPNYAYKFKSALDPAYIYRIIVTNPATGEVDSADAPVIDDRNGGPFYVYYIDDTASHPTLDFSSTASLSTITLTGRYTPPNNFSFNGSTTPVAAVQAFIRFHWVDSNVSTGATTAKYFDHNIGYIFLNGTGFSYDVKNTELYNAINSGIGIAPAFTDRLMDRCELIFYLGTTDFYNYITVQSLQGTGLTGNEIQPTYTNIKGQNVLGLYTSRGLRSGYITISPNTIESLKTSPLVEGVRIKGTVYH